MSKYIKLDDAMEAKCPCEDIWEDCINCPLNNSGIEPCKMGKWLKSLPTIEVSERTGEWRDNELGIFCSACGNGFICSDTDVDEMKRELHFCPNCGKKMKGDTENPLGILHPNFKYETGGDTE